MLKRSLISELSSRKARVGSFFASQQPFRARTALLEGRPLSASEPLSDSKESVRLASLEP